LINNELHQFVVDLVNGLISGLHQGVNAEVVYFAKNAVFSGRKWAGIPDESGRRFRSKMGER
jgi:hypothetical protein